jgi:aryl-alcohol dehydrogenase-like predicted oxidoreductase
VPLEETLAALDQLVRQGKVRHVALSNYPAWQVCRALRIADRRQFASVAAVQPHYHLLHRQGEEDLFPLCLEEGVGVASYSPLAGGLLTGKYSGAEPPPGSRAARDPAFARRILSDASLKVVADLRAVAEEEDLTLSRLALAWVLANPAVTAAIVGATSPDQLQESIPAADLTLPQAVVERLNDISAA